MATQEPPASPGPTLDMAMFPHLFDLIVAYAPHASLLALRTASRSTRDKVDGVFARHLTIEITDPRFYEQCEYLAPVYIGSPRGRVPLFMGWTTEEPSEPEDAARRRLAIELVAKHTRVVDSLEPIGDEQAAPLFTAIAEGLERQPKNERSWMYRNRGWSHWSGKNVDVPILHLTSDKHASLLLDNLTGLLHTPHPLRTLVSGDNPVPIDMQCTVQHIGLWGDVLNPHLLSHLVTAMRQNVATDVHPRVGQALVPLRPDHLVLIFSHFHKRWPATPRSFLGPIGEYAPYLRARRPDDSLAGLRLKKKVTLVNLLPENSMQVEVPRLRTLMYEVLQWCNQQSLANSNSEPRDEEDNEKAKAIQLWLEESLIVSSLDEFRATVSPEAFALLTEDMESAVRLQASTSGDLFFPNMTVLRYCFFPADDVPEFDE